MKYNRLQLILTGVSLSLYAGVDVDNRSLYPFLIKSITYEQNDGLSKTPAIEQTTVIVQPSSRINLSSGRPDPILHISGTHNNIPYAFSFDPNGPATVLITADNQLKVQGEAHLEEKTVATKRQILRYL